MSTNSKSDRLRPPKSEKSSFNEPFCSEECVVVTPSRGSECFSLEIYIQSEVKSIRPILAWKFNVHPVHGVILFMSLCACRWWSWSGVTLLGRPCSSRWPPGTAARMTSSISWRSWSDFRRTHPSSSMTPCCPSSTTNLPRYAPFQ